MQESFTVCMCDKIGVSVRAYNVCTAHVCMCVCVCVHYAAKYHIDTMKNRSC